MNAFDTTTRDLARALLGRPRAQQTVREVSRIHSGSPFGARIVVLVDGEYYEVGQRIFDELRSGVTPAELELETYEPEEEDEAIGPSPDSLRRWYEGKVL